MTADLLRLQAQPGSQLGPRSLQNKVQCLATLPDCDTVLYRLQMVQATGLMYDYFLFLPATSQAVQDARQQFWRQINQRPPQVFVVARGPFPTGRPEYQRLQSWPEFEQFLAQKYSLYDEHEYPQEKDRSVLGFRMYVKKQPQ
jgi:hypothetical protein